MAHGSTTISPPVVMPTDIAAILGIAGTDLATLCTSSAINKWAKYKPVRYADMDVLSDYQRTQANWGIDDIPSWTRLDYMAAFMFSSSRGSLSSTYWPQCDRNKGYLSSSYFNYLKPNGGSSAPYRLSDFAKGADYTLGYYHEAEAPFDELVVDTVYIGSDGYVSMVFGQGAMNDYTIKLSDLVFPGSSNISLGNMYFSVIMKKLDDYRHTNAYVCSQDVTLSQTSSGLYVRFYLTASQSWMAGTWQLYPIISDYQFSFGTVGSTSGHFIAVIPDHKNISMQIRYAKLEIDSSEGYRDMTSSNRYVYVNVDVTNKDTTTRTYKVTVRLYNSSGTEQTSYSQTESVTLSGGASTTVSFEIYVAQIWSSLNGGYYSVETTINSSSDSAVFYQSDSISQTQLTDRGSGPTPGTKNVAIFHLDGDEDEYMELSGSAVLLNNVVKQKVVRVNPSSRTMGLYRIRIAVLDSNGESVYMHDFFKGSAVHEDASPWMLYPPTTEWNFLVDISSLGYSGNEGYTIHVRTYYEFDYNPNN